MKCLECGLPIPEMPEDATYDECLCDLCYMLLVEPVEEEVQ